MKVKCFVLVCGIHVFLGAFCQKDKKDFVPDTTVNKINLSDYQSTERLLGDIVWEKQFEEEGILPRIELLNKAKTQVLRLLFHYGGSKNSVDEFEIIAIDSFYKVPKKAIIVDFENFVTGRGIKLGLNKNAVLDRLGRNYKVFKEKDGTEIIVYQISSQKSSFLQRYNRFEYHINCVFKCGVLISYAFGFDYP